MLDDADIVSSKKSKAAKHPVIQLDKRTSKSLAEFVEQKRIKKEAEAEMKVAQAPVLDFCQGIIDDRGFEGQYENCFTVETADRRTKQTLVLSDRFIVPQDDLPRLQHRLGDKFDQIIEVKKEVVMKPEVLEDERLQKKLIKLLGGEFKRFFAVKKTYTTVKGLKQSIYHIAGNEDSLKRIRSMVPQVTASLKG
jgi:hypothetical protein